MMMMMTMAMAKKILSGEKQRLRENEAEGKRLRVRNKRATEHTVDI